MGWLDVPSALANIGATLAFNLTTNDGLTGVTFIAYETDPGLLDIYVGTTLTTQYDLTGISAIINGTTAGDSLTFDASIGWAVTVNGGGADSITLDGGTWGTDGAAFVYTGTSAYSLTVEDGDKTN